MKATTSGSIAALVLTIGLLACTSTKNTMQPSSNEPGAMMKGSDKKITNAMSAAPDAVGKDATVMDWPVKEGGEFAMLKKGTNGWTCLPDYPGSPGNDPMCMDGMAMQWAGAWTTKKQPHLATAGLGYMLQGGSDASNTDPFAEKPAPGQDWLNAPPHVMIFPAGGKIDTSVYSTNPKSGGPWIMWAGTAYQHLMVPVQ